MCRKVENHHANPAVVLLLDSQYDLSWEILQNSQRYLATPTQKSYGFSSSLIM